MADPQDPPALDPLSLSEARTRCRKLASAIVEAAANGYVSPDGTMTEGAHDCLTRLLDEHFPYPWGPGTVPARLPAALLSENLVVVDLSSRDHRLTSEQIEALRTVRDGAIGLMLSPVCAPSTRADALDRAYKIQAILASLP